jgi:phage shock protein C
MQRIYRSRADKKIAGICGGLSEMFDVDPTLIRLAMVFTAIATGVAPLAITYLVGWWIVPIGAPIAPASSAAPLDDERTANG